MYIIALPPRMMSRPQKHGSGLDRRKERIRACNRVNGLLDISMTFEIQCKFFFSMLSSPCVIFRTLCYGLNCILLKTIRRRKWQPTPVPLPGKSHGWISLVGYSPWGRKESDMTGEPQYTNKYYKEKECVAVVTSGTSECHLIQRQDLYRGN